MKIKEKPFKEIIEKISMFDKRLISHSLHNQENIEQLLKAYGKKSQLTKDLEKAKSDVKKAKSLLQMADLKCMKRVLRRMGYCTSTDVIEVKGNT
jgi:ATP-dependent RNA helicase DOB1